MKKLLVLVLSLAMVLSLSACGNKETKKSDSDSSKKKFTVGFDAEYPPYGYMDSDILPGMWNRNSLPLPGS